MKRKSDSQVQEVGASSCTKGETVTAFGGIHLSRKMNLANFIRCCRHWSFETTAGLLHRFSRNCSRSWTPTRVGDCD